VYLLEFGIGRLGRICIQQVRRESKKFGQLCVSRLSRNCGNLDFSQTYRPPRPVIAIAFLLAFHKIAFSRSSIFLSRRGGLRYPMGQDLRWREIKLSVGQSCQTGRKVGASPSVATGPPCWWFCVTIWLHPGKMHCYETSAGLPLLKWNWPRPAQDCSYRKEEEILTSLELPVGKATCCLLEHRGIGVRISIVPKMFTLHIIQTGFGVHAASYPIGTRVSFPGGEAIRA
jgi:hypothetical protein